MANMLTPNTTLALMQASQGNTQQAVKNAKDARELEKVEHAAKEFEAVFVAEMMKPLFEGLSTEAPFGGGKGEEVFRGILIQEYGKMIAEGGGIGLTSQIKEQMIKMQEQADNAVQVKTQ
jgi:flagellar protein FlgJ